MSLINATPFKSKIIPPNWSTPTQLAKLLASNYANSDAFGKSVSISDNGMYIAMGAPVKDSSQGTAYVYNYNGATWSQQAIIVASDPETGDQFGTSVALNADGTTLAVSAPYENTSPYTDNGAIYVFTRSGTSWTQQQKLVVSDAINNGRLGSNEKGVAISDDGNTIITGSYIANSTNGAAYVFTRSGGTWTQQQKLVASDAAGVDYFGWSVALSADGNTALIGCTLHDNGVSGSNKGAGYVFTRTGGTWTQQQKLVASDAANDDNLGASVALSADGNTGLISAYYKNSFTGAAYVFTRTGGTWTQQQKLVASDAANDDFYGMSVTLSNDGNISIIGSFGEDTSPTTDQGAAYVYNRTGGTWTQQQKLLASDRQNQEAFGSSVFIDGNGKTAIIGARQEHTPPWSFNGAGYVFVA